MIFVIISDKEKIISLCACNNSSITIIYIKIVAKIMTYGVVLVKLV